MEPRDRYSTWDSQLYAKFIMRDLNDFVTQFMNVVQYSNCGSILQPYYLCIRASNYFNKTVFYVAALWMADKYIYLDDVYKNI